MKPVFGIFVTVVVLVLQTGPALAAPKQGIGVNAGFAYHNMTPTGGFMASTSKGMSLGVDYQLIMSDRWTLNPFVMSSAETSSESGVELGHVIIGVQGRYWFNDFFVGGQVGNYSEVRTIFNTTSVARGFGAGLVVGWEDPISKVSVTAQIDKTTVKYSNADVAISGFRLNMGYRWE